MEVTSTAFQEAAMIPKQCTEDGKDLSPPLQWSGVPVGAKSIALICDDPDAPRKEPWVHWVVYDVPPSTHELSEGLPALEDLPGGGKQGKNDFGKIGYDGPAPPPGKAHRYYFKLYALDALLELPAGASKHEVEQAMKGHIVAQGQLMGKYGR
jgi:Raf kinase inhibitor-like YbhB/YbcL family protein